MTRRRRRLPVLLLAALLAAACGSEPVVPPSASAVPTGMAPGTTPAPTERAFERTAWPRSGSACDAPGSKARIGRIEAVSERTIRFTLCAPDGAFLARLAHPALGIVDATSVDAVAENPARARAAAGAGDYRVDSWTAGDNVRLARITPAGDQPEAGDQPAQSASPSAAAGPPSASPFAVAPSASGTPSPGGPPPVIVVRWDPSSADRAAALQDAAVDGVDAPEAADLAGIETLPELAVTPRPGLATAYLGFGAGGTFAPVAVRRAFAEGLDHGALARDAFPAGSVPATHVAPCEVPGGCEGRPWYEFNGPAGTAALTDAGFNRRAKIPLHVPDAPVPGLPDPAGVAAAVRDQLADSLGVTVVIDPMPAAALADAISKRALGGLYLGGIESTLADASGFLEPLFGPGATGSAASRARGVRAALTAAAATADPVARRVAFATANEGVRSSAAVVPLVHPGSTVAYRADVAGVAVSPIWVDPLGTFVPADRRQLVVMQASEPSGAWCAIDPEPAASRLCALVTPGLYAFRGASLAPEPALASRCTPSDKARVWTCRLRAGLAFSDGKGVDAGDVVASLAAQADAGSALRRAFPPAAFAAWDALLGGPVDTRPAPSAPASAGPGPVASP